MTYGVFIHRADSIYADRPTERYQFPSQYLLRAEACVGEWIIYYAPRKAQETQGYYAIARVQQIIPDPSKARMYFATIDPTSYMGFVKAVPFSGPDGVIERGLLNKHGRISGRAQSAIRPISPDDFRRIVNIGLDDGEPVLPRVDEASAPLQVNEEQAPFEFEQSRDRSSYLSSRIVRDRLFRRIILDAYDQRCAITGLKLINGGGRAEVNAAHIRPVEANGPDTVNNGIALSGTAHWMFDRGLISLADDLEILISRQVNDPDSVRALVNKTRYALPPQKSSQRPHPAFLSWHREHCFKH